ncbi:MAG: sigma 54-interacting transcriptional regulator [Nitrospirae bacterium YQR-1]
MSVKREIFFVGNDAAVLAAVAAMPGLQDYGFHQIESFVETALPSNGALSLVLIDFSYLNGNSIAKSIDVLAKVKELAAAAETIVLYEDMQREDAMNALAMGAFFCIKKPFHSEELKTVMQRAMEGISLRDEVERLKADALPQGNEMVGENKKFRRALKEAESFFDTENPVLILGESGTGKRNLARFIHFSGHKKDGTFLVVNADSMPEDMAGPDMFGWEKGAFTGAKEYGAGSIALCSEGTVYISEITSLSPALQERVLSFIKTKKYSPFGTKNVLTSNARVIASSKENIPELVRKKLFLKELSEVFYGAEIRIPPLRERKSDIIPLAEYFLAKYVLRYGLEKKKFGGTSTEYFMNHYWPENIRELKKTVKHAAILTKASEINYKDIVYYDTSKYSISEFLEKKIVNYLQDVTGLSFGNLYSTIVDEVERTLISMALRETSGNQLKASRILGINRNTLRTKAKQFQVEK